MNIAKGVGGILGRLHFGHAYFTSEELFGFEDAVITFFRTCNYIDTIYATLVINALANWLFNLSNRKHINLGWLSKIVSLVDWFGAISAFADAAYYVDIALETPNMFGFGKIIAKLSKFLL